MVNEWTSNDVPSVSSLDLHNKRPDLDLGGMRFGAAVAFEAMVKHLNKVHPKPRPVTRQDLPTVDEIHGPVLTSGAIESAAYCTVGVVLDAVVEHLNANGGVPADPVDQLMHEVNNPDPEKVALDEARIKANIERNEARRETARWRRAHSIVEGERDQARERLRETETKLARCMSDFQDVEDERDEWKSRAVAAEARTAPAVTKADIEKAIRGASNAKYGTPNAAGFVLTRQDLAADAVWSLVSGSDPAVFVVRESEIEAVEVHLDEHDHWIASSEGVAMKRHSADEVRRDVKVCLNHIAQSEAVARRIEAEAGQATDPVEELARELYEAAWPDDRDPDTSTDIWQTCENIARHQIGQEANDGR